MPEIGPEEFKELLALYMQGIEIQASRSRKDSGCARS